MKGIILAGGHGTRLRPLTTVISKQLLPIYNKPMVFYPLSTLMQGGIRDILLISTKEDLPQYRRLLGDGEQFGITIEYVEQENPRGLPEAFIIGSEFIGDNPVTLILGDNIFYSKEMSRILSEAIEGHSGATVFGVQVKDPERFGVARFDANGDVVEIVEKPKNPPSNVAVTGLYIYSNDVIEKSRRLVVSERGELEISELNQNFISEERLSLVKLGEDTRWLDTGTHDSMLEAAIFVKDMEESSLISIGHPARVSLEMGFIKG